jgi:hypothetical protein
MYFQDAADPDAIGKHVEVVVIPLAGWAARRDVLYRMSLSFADEEYWAEESF